MKYLSTIVVGSAPEHAGVAGAARVALPQALQAAPAREHFISPGMVKESTAKADHDHTNSDSKHSLFSSPFISRSVVHTLQRSKSVHVSQWYLSPEWISL